jgi:putative two-component system response regulator
MSDPAVPPPRDSTSAGTAAPEGEDARPVVLVVEDDLANRILLCRLLDREGYATRTAADGLAALDLIATQLPDLVLLDVGIPGLDGHAVCRRLREEARTRTLPVILLTGRSGVEDVVAGLDSGADDFVAKPYDIHELMARIRSALRVRRALAEMEAAHGVVAALANAVEAKDATTERHCQRLAGYAYHVGRAVGLEAVELKGVVFGALLHDVGKIGIPEAILVKPGPLDEAEWATMRTHPVIGERICRPLVASRLFAPIVRHHHERWDGRGYPDGRRGEDIPLGARIVAVCDAFHAMTSERPYSRVRRVDEAIAELRRCKGTQFDPQVVDAFCEALAEHGRRKEQGATPLPARRLSAAVA